MDSDAARDEIRAMQPDDFQALRPEARAMGETVGERYQKMRGLIHGEAERRDLDASIRRPNR